MIDSLETEIVHNAWGAQEAEEILALLRGCGIPAIAPGLFFVSVYGVTINGLASIPISTPKRFASEARRIIAAPDVGNDAALL